MKFLIALLISTPVLGFAQSTDASYYRFWQGFKKEGLSESAFMKELPTFMKDTVTLYKGKGLSNYIVVIPPKDKPAHIPDEFALVAFDSEKSYRTVRETPEGANYSARHWDVFAKETSKSATLKSGPINFEENVAYDLLNRPVNWSKGITHFYLADNSKAPEKTKKALNDAVASFTASKNEKKINGVLLLTNSKYTAIFINSNQTDAIQEIRAALNKTLSEVMYESSEAYTNQNLEHNKVYTTINDPILKITCDLVDGRTLTMEGGKPFRWLSGTDQVNPFDCIRDRDAKGNFYRCESYYSTPYFQVTLPDEVLVSESLDFSLQVEHIDENTGDVDSREQVNCHSQIF